MSEAWSVSVASKSGSFSPTPGGRCIFLREFRWTYSSLSTLQKTIPWVLYCTLGIPGIPVNTLCIFVEVVKLLWTNIWMKLRFPKYQYKFKMWRCSKLSSSRSIHVALGGMSPGWSNSNSWLWDGWLLKANLSWDRAVALQQDTNLLPRMYCCLKGKRAEKSLIQFPPLHVVWLKSPHLLVFCRGSGNSSNSSSFVAGQIPFRLLGLLRLCWKVTLQSAVLDPTEDQRYVLNYTIESFSAKDDRTGILYPQQQEYRTLHTFRKMIREKKGKRKKKKKNNIITESHF